MKPQMINVLLVEDSPADIDLTKDALERSKLNVNLSVVEDGVAAMQYLRREDPYKDVLEPDLILLDLNLPKKDGREVLKEIKQDDHLQHLPVVILTTSDDEADILGTYKDHANCYIRKPVNFSRFEEIVKSIESFWFTIVKLPK